VSFARRHALITGGSSGIGRATARLLASRGADVSIIARGQSRLDEARREIEAARSRPDGRVVALAADVADPPQAERAVAAAIEQLGPPDVVVTSAGIARPGYFEEMPLDVFERTMAVNYFGTLLAIRAALPSMLERRRGHLVLISSGVALVGVFGYSSYAPTKHAVRGLAEVLRAELGPRGIGVSCVYPPDTDTAQLAEENKTKPAETRRINQTGGLMSADAVAAEIVRGIERRRFTIAPGIEMTLLSRLNFVVAPLLGWHFDRIVARTRR
jgi:3-dehydrosphinganine reductase